MYYLLIHEKVPNSYFLYFSIREKIKSHKVTPVCGFTLFNRNKERQLLASVGGSRKFHPAKIILNFPAMSYLHINVFKPFFFLKLTGLL